MSLKSDIGRLVRQLEAEGVPVALATYDTITTIEIHKAPFFLWIDSRPAYCDRGRWLVHARSVDVTLAVVDDADMFPRYYFNDDALAKEVRAWLDVRMAGVNRKLAARNVEHEQ